MKSLEARRRKVEANGYAQVHLFWLITIQAFEVGTQGQVLGVTIFLLLPNYLL